MEDARANVLSDWRAGRRERALWIEYDAYAGRVFAGAPRDWLCDARRYAATLAQAHAVLPTEVLSLDVLAAHLGSLERDDGDPLAVLEGTLQLGAPASFADEIVEALVHRFAGRVDLVLKIRSPAELLVACGASPENAATALDDLDDCATLLAAFIKRYAGRPIAALQIASSAPGGMGAGEIDSCAPLLGAASHYGWLSVFAFEGWRAQALPQSAGDLLLLPEARPEVLAADTERRYGGGLGADFWLGLSRIQKAPSLLHGRVPQDAEPETVAARAAALGA